MTTENTDSDLKVRALHYANELLVRVRLSFQKLFQTRLMCRNNTKKNVWETSTGTYLLSVRVQTTINHILTCFSTTISASKKMFFFRARAEKGIARHIDASSVVWTLRPRLHESGKIFARKNFVPGPAVYMGPCRIRANSVAVVFTRIRAKFRPVAAFDSRP